MQKYVLISLLHTKDWCHYQVYSTRCLWVLLQLLNWQTYRQTYVCILAKLQQLAPPYTCMHAHIHTHTHTHAHARTHMHTSTQLTHLYSTGTFILMSKTEDTKYIPCRKTQHTWSRAHAHALCKLKCRLLKGFPNTYKETKILHSNVVVMQNLCTRMSLPHHNLCQTQNQDVRRLHIGQGIEELRWVGIGGKIACVLSELYLLTCAHH